MTSRRRKMGVKKVQYEGRGACDFFFFFHFVLVCCRARARGPTRNSDPQMRKRVWQGTNKAIANPEETTREETTQTSERSNGHTVPLYRGANKRPRKKPNDIRTSSVHSQGSFLTGCDFSFPKKTDGHAASNAITPHITDSDFPFLGAVRTSFEHGDSCRTFRQRSTSQPFL